MSIDVVKAYKAYPMTDENHLNNEINAKRLGYQQGYAQAMQDFMEKAEKYLEPHIQCILLGDMHDTSAFLQDFKNYMQDE